MLLLILMFLIGAFVGWNFPQPQFAADVQDWILDWVDRFNNRLNK